MCIDAKKVKLIAFDLDGTLTQHKSKLTPENLAVLKALRAKYRLLMVGAGTCRRIFEQLDRFPIDVIGNYGMQYARYNEATGDIDIVRDEQMPVDRAATEEKVTYFREKYGFTAFAGDSVEYHPSGCVTFPVLGTKAVLADKLAIDPDRARRRAIYGEVKEAFSDYTVFVGGSSSVDMAPFPYNKAYSLTLYCEEHGIAKDEAVFVGDDYGPGGNDESVLLDGYAFVKIDDYRTLPEKLAVLL